MMFVEEKTPLWLAARVLLHERGDDFFRRRDKVLKTFDPEDIHDLRVSSRRLHEGLELFLPCYPAELIEPLVKLSKKVTRLLGEIRNTDEALGFFDALMTELDDFCQADLERLNLSFLKKRKKDLRRLRAGLKVIASDTINSRYRHGVNSPALFSSPPTDVDLFAPLAVFAGSSLDDRMAAVMNLAPEAKQADAIKAQHQLRIAVKHFRYRMEILFFLFGERFPELHALVKGYQEVLGKMHDLDVFAGIVRAAGFSPSTEGVVLGTIAAKRSQLFAEFSGMLKNVPLERIGEQARSAL
jgi:CHAD domain-containing protein